MINITFDWNEISALINILRQKGILYLIGNSMPVPDEEEDADPVDLIKRLATCGYPLVENAGIALFILHPELAPAAAEALQSSAGDTTENIAVLVLATLYLQQWWIFRLAFALSRLPSFPEAPFASLWQERHLPAPDAGYGLDGLLALQTYQQHRYSLPLNFFSDWQNQIDHLLAQEDARQRDLSGNLKNTLVQLMKSGA